MAKNIKHLEFGSPLSSSNVGSPDRQLEAYLNELAQRVESAEIGSGLLLHDQPVNSSTVSGTPVYWSTNSNRWEPALAAFSTTPGGNVTPAPSSIVGGIVFKKTTSTVATLLVSGSADFTGTPLLASNPDQGLYYLSSVTAGATVQTRPSVAVPVYCLIGNRVLFSTVPPDPSSHEHRRIHLTCLPAGTHVPPSTVGATHVITSPNPGLPGWLPADHASFSGLAPVGAKFGYNLGQDPFLQAVFPLESVDSAALFWDTGLESWLIGGMDVKLVGSEALCTIDRNGIWWMTDEYMKVPWPADYDTGNPGPHGMSLTLDTTRLALSTSGTVVTSLHSHSPILEITRCDGNPGTTGGLCVDLDFSNAIDKDVAVTGALCVKSVHPDTGLLLAGNMTEGLVSGSNVTLSSTVQRYLVPGDASTPIVHQGVITVSADIDPLGRELPLSFVRLSDARVSNLGPVAYFGFPPGQQSSLTSQVLIPRSGLSATPSIKFRLELLSLAAGGFPTPQITIRRLPAASSSTSQIPQGDLGLPLNMPGGVSSVQPQVYFAAETNSTVVQPGDTLFVTVTRVAGDAYPGEVGLLRFGAILQ